MEYDVGCIEGNALSSERKTVKPETWIGKFDDPLSNQQ